MNRNALIYKIFVQYIGSNRVCSKGLFLKFFALFLTRQCQQNSYSPFGFAPTAAAQA